MRRNALPLTIAMLCLTWLATIADLSAAETPPPTPEKSASAGPAVVLVIDGSGSMWGNLAAERGAKIELTQAALRKALSPISPSVRLALLSFGQRRRADCSDAEVLAPLEAGPSERILALSDKLNPKGKGPLALALREAAKQVPGDTDATIIVVHDGPDNCQQDPCATAAEIAKTNSRLVVHTIGLGLEAADAQRMTCVARATNGRSFEVQDATSLEAALNETLRLANLEDPVSPATAGSAAVQPVPAVPGLRLSASYSEGGPARHVAVHWRILKTEAAGTVVLETHAPELSLNVAPGAYTVEASYGLAQVRRSIDVTEEGPTVARLNLDAGTLKLNARTSKGAPLSDPILTIEALAAAQASGPADGDPIWVGRDASSEIIVPRGSYLVRVEDGLAKREVTVSVAPGETAIADLALGTGRLEVSALKGPGAEALRDVVFAISEDDPDAPQGRRELARSADPAPFFTVPAGTYYLTARYGAAELRERLAVGSGDTVKHAFTFNVARLSVAVQLDAMAEPDGQTVAVRVFKADDPHREVARSTALEASFTLPPQKYRIEAQLGENNVRATADIDLQAGRDTKLALKLETATLTVAPPQSGARTAMVHWRVKDSRGRTVLHSGPGGSTSVRLAPGRYVVQSDDDHRRTDETLDLKPGMRQTLELARP
ncbi:MAG: VWA domain-containing protein [Hyphomicrobium sp.]|jgi:Ca-activated chloride channel family protein